MEENETGYDQEGPADQEVTEPALEGPEQGPAEPEPEETEADPAEDPVEGPAGGEDETGTDPEEGTEEDPVEEPEEPAEETREPDPETVSENDLTVSGNDLVVSGDVIIPEDYDLSTLGGEPADTESIVQAVEKQTEVMTAGFTCTCFMLGVLAGALVITGFRLRRV